MSKIDSTKNGFWDRLGIGLSGVCAIHCLLVPFFVALIPLWPAVGNFHAYSHLIFIVAIAPTVYLSLKRQHSSKKVSVYLFAGVAVIVLAWLVSHEVGMYGEAGITLIGSSLLIRGHWLNYKSKTCKT
ncbi:MAG: MerC domain-containing protein [Balneolaceae bacterium]